MTHAQRDSKSSPEANHIAALADGLRLSDAGEQPAPVFREYFARNIGGKLLSLKNTTT